jgi:hypothetical protein
MTSESEGSKRAHETKTWMRLSRGVKSSQSDKAPRIETSAETQARGLTRFSPPLD